MGDGDSGALPALAVQVQGYLTGAAVGGVYQFSDPPYIVIVH